jgi:hypothetical protein
MAEQAARKQERLLRTHQPGQDSFRIILSEDIEWKPFPSFPPEARLAVLVGNPSEAGPYMVRVKVPHGVKLMPHRHPEDFTLPLGEVRRICHAGDGNGPARPGVRRLERRPAESCHLNQDD